MDIHFGKKQPIVVKKDKRVNPYRFWTFFVSGMLLALTGMLLWSSIFFQKTIETLDAPVLPKLFTERGPINAIERSVVQAEKALSARIGEASISTGEGE